MKLAIINGKGNNAIHLHEKPDLNSKILLSIPDETKVLFNSINDTWSESGYLGKKGYIMNDFLKEIENIPKLEISQEQLVQYLQKVDELLSMLNEVV